MSLATFVLRYLPPPPARVLEIGCGPVGDLTSAIAAAGYEIVAVDPVAPEGPLFRRIPFEECTEPGPFDVVAFRPWSSSLLSRAVFARFPVEVGAEADTLVPQALAP